MNNLELFVIPEPIEIEFSGEWAEFDGFSNLPEILYELFGLKKGTWTIERADRKGQGVSSKGGKLKVWGDKFSCYSTLIQLSRNRKGYFPIAEIHEDSKFTFRGFHLDIARGGVPIQDTYNELIKWLFLAKFNKLALYVEDLFPWRSFPDIGRKRGRVTEEEWNFLVKLGGELGIDVFPSLELLGHMEHILKLPDYRKYSEIWWRPMDGCLDVSNEESTEFATSLLRDASTMTKSDLVHIGGDETWSLGRGRSLDRNGGKYDGPNLYLNHYRTLVNETIRMGKKPVIWGDMLTGMYLTESEKKVWGKVVEDSIWDSCIIANWDYEPEDIEHFVEKIKSIGRFDRQIACPGIHNWTTFYPDFDIGMTNVKSFLTAARKTGLPGYMITAWGDDSQECLYSFLKPMLFASSDYSADHEDWVKKYSVITGEEESVSELRFTLGKTQYAPALKRVMYSEHFDIRWSPKLAEGWKDSWHKLIDSASSMSLPEDLKLIIDMMKVYSGYKKPGESLILDEHIKEFRKLWMRERKPETLPKAISRMYGPVEFRKAADSR